MAITYASMAIPRSINILCDAALVYRMPREVLSMDDTVISEAIRDRQEYGVFSQTLELEDGEDIAGSALVSWTAGGRSPLEIAMQNSSNSPIGLLPACGTLLYGLPIGVFYSKWRLGMNRLMSILKVLRVVNMNKLALVGTLGAALSLGLASGAQSATTGLNFVGGCVENAISGTMCSGGNASIENVGAILGETAILLGSTENSPNGTGDTPWLSASVGSVSGSWALDTSYADALKVTHLAFKSNGYYILAEITATSGTWEIADDTTTGGPVSGALRWGDGTAQETCPVSICDATMPLARAYVNSDFRNPNNAAALSNIRAFSVNNFFPPAEVPLPAAAWMFLSGVGLYGFVRRGKKSSSAA